MSIRREPLIDVLRGLALLGIIVVHVRYFSYPGQEPQFSRVMFPALVDRTIEFAVNWLIVGKFYPVFAFLFGWGAYVMAQADAGFSIRFLRRLAGLFALGVIHHIFFFVGDILTTYAVVGLVLLAAIERSTPTASLVAWAKRMIVIAAVVAVAFEIVSAWFLTAAVTDPGEFRDLVRAFREASFRGMAEYRLETAPSAALGALFLVPSVAAMFFLGLAAAQTYAREGLAAARPLARRLAPWTLAVGLVGNLLVLAVGHHARIQATGIDIGYLAGGIFGPLLAIGYISLATLVLAGPCAEALAGTVGATGRMSLTQYLAQSVVSGFIYFGHGFGQFGRLEPRYATLLAIAVWVGLTAFAVLWLAAFRIGPVEWVLRSMSEARFVPLRRGQHNEAIS